jgi:DNA-binding CsgD family transcriptional regulator
VTSLLDEAWGSRGGALVLHGQPGVGKSTLLQDAREQADGMLVLSTQGIESESPLAFAALQRLLSPLMDTTETLPPVQAHALRVALGLERSDRPPAAVGEPSERFVVFLAVLGLLSGAAEHAPVLCLVDDAHWLDDATASALQFVARRLVRERIAMLFCARDGDARQFDSSGLPHVLVTGLDVHAAGELLAAGATVPLAPAVAARLIAETGGNPLALVELPSALSAEQLAGIEQLPDTLPVTDGIESAFLDRFRRLDQAAQTVLLVASADASTRLGIVQDAARTLGVDPGTAALDGVERSGLLQVVGDRVEFRHPLVRSAIFQAATSSTRRDVHRALATALETTSDVERRAWHLAEAATGPDERVAAGLDDAAQRALRRGGYEAASAAFERAARLSDVDDSRARRLHAAASSAWLGGDPGRAGALAGEGCAATDRADVVADLEQLRGRAEFHVGSVTTAIRVWTQAARDVIATDRVRAREIAVMAAAASTFAPPAERTDLTPAELSVELSPEPRGDVQDREQCVPGLLVGFHHLLAGRLAAAAPAFQAAFGAAQGVSEPDLTNAIGIAAYHLGDDVTFRRTFSAILGYGREHAAYGLVLFALPRLALGDFCEGRLGDAIGHATEARQLAETSGELGLTAMPLAELALYGALRGDGGVDQHLADLDEVLSKHQVGVLGAIVVDARRWAVAERDLAAGRHADALHHLERMKAPPLIHLAAHARLEAAVRADRHDLAQAWAEELTVIADAVGFPHAHAAACFASALVATTTEDADGRFEEALRACADSGRPLETARTRLAFGEHLRRTRRRVAAREHLREALNAFGDAGAKPLTERARHELRASGETVRRRDETSDVAELTPQERQVAKFVASGLSNRDVAAQLFLSPRTIDFHPRNVYAKLGLSSRAELAQLTFD